MFNNSVSRSGRSLLEDEELTVPVPTEATPLAQAQRTMARWSNGPDHKVRRALAERDLSSLDNVALRGRAHALATQELLTATDLGEVARFVPVAVLAETLGFNHPQLAAHHQRVVSMAIAPEAGTPQTDEDAVNHSLNWLVVASGVTRFETAINRIALLHQCLDATAGLIALAALHLATRGQLRDAPEPDPAKSFIAWTIRNDPPVTQTIRVGRSCSTIKINYDCLMACGCQAGACPKPIRASARSGAVTGPEAARPSGRGHRASRARALRAHLAQG